MRSARSPVSRLCLGAALCCTAFIAHGSTTLYKWVDAEGVTHYSDRPEPGAQKVKIAAAQTYKGGAPPVAAPRAQPAAPAVSVSYSRLEITNPENGAVLWNTGGRVDVDAALEPELADGHQLWFMVDGKTQQAASGGTTSLEVPRGSHTLVATVTDATGKELISSAPVSIVVQQTSIGQPPQGPALPKPPKPTPH
jgi:Domain of unknown function (DUF4124)/Penicillin-Binding Protein C-terminus Family